MLSIEDQYQLLVEYMTPERIALFEEVIQSRTKHVAVVLEDPYQPHNASAVLRSCDCFGIQNVHVIENQNEFNVNKNVALGAGKWLNIHKYHSQQNNTRFCLDHLKASGYRIVATSPHEGTEIGDLDLTSPMALVFGTELEGISDTVVEMADEMTRIPMYGFTESFNISVATALCLYQVTQNMRQSDVDWHFSEKEQLAIKLVWAKSSVKDSAAIIERKILDLGMRE
jgi:tRNA (guanosine-2'-O-)-methyltransferase